MEKSNTTNLANHFAGHVFQMNVTRVRSFLPDGDFNCMVQMLQKFLSFIELTVSTLSAIVTNPVIFENGSKKLLSGL